MENEEIKKPATKTTKAKTTKAKTTKPKTTTKAKTTKAKAKPKPTPKVEPETVETTEYNPLEGVKATEIREIHQSVIDNENAEIEEKKKEEELINIAQQIQKKINEMRVLTDQEIYESYVSEGRPYLIYFNDRLVFDSTISDKKNLRFLEEGFQIHGRTYNYTGIKFKFKK